MFRDMQQTAGGILLPESNVSKANEGEVIAVGPGYTARDGTKISVNLDVGDKVVLPEYGGLSLKIEGDEAFIFRADEILAKYAK
jgi:chaperonin GroES